MRKQIFLKIYIAFVFASFTCFPILSLESNLNLLTIWICSAVIWYLIAGLFLKYGGNITGFIKERTEKLDAFMDRRLKAKTLT
ncbi:MAG: hypothetical protein J5626_08670 [Lachnospiraceae bacterium]|nr:hypothetical protein [Lachnospiraceae bacterium]